MRPSDVRLTCRTIPERSMLDDRYFLPGLRRQHSPAGPSGGSYVSVTLETEQVTAVLDVLCFGQLSNLHQSQQIRESVGWGRYPASTPLPRVLCSLSPPVCHCVLCEIRRDLTQSITLKLDFTVISVTSSSYGKE